MADIFGGVGVLKYVPYLQYVPLHRYDLDFYPDGFVKDIADVIDKFEVRDTLAVLSLSLSLSL